jgi:hypothetical protein
MNDKDILGAAQILSNNYYWSETQKNHNDNRTKMEQINAFTKIEQEKIKEANFQFVVQAFKQDGYSYENAMIKAKEFQEREEKLIIAENKLKFDRQDLEFEKYWIRIWYSLGGCVVGGTVVYMCLV